jgi:UDP-N-acetylmuramoyl-tripeptide--D-alanyl-D-alanine ligase
MLTLADLLKALTGQNIEGASLIISEASIDSRQVIPASLFIALPGERVDGHDYVENAFTRGAHLALVQKDLSGQFPQIDLSSGEWQSDTKLPRPPFCIRVADSLAALQKIAAYWRSRQTLRVIGITGSVGKSTTKELVAEVLSQRFHTLRNTGNLNNEIGLPLTLLRLTEAHQRAVLEMGFYVTGEIDFLCQIAKPHIGVVTNIGTVHAERAGSQETIARGKAELVKSLPSDGVAILNYDDPWVRDMAALTNAHVLFYGLTPDSNLWASDIESLGLEGIRFCLHWGNERIHMRVPLIGRHSVHTALRAAAVGLVEGLTWQEIGDGLTHSRSQLRLVAVHTQNGALLLDDTYNASPESTLASLNLLGELNGRRVAVLGDMYELGQYEQQGHTMVGARAAEVCAELVAVGTLGKMIAEAAINAGLPAYAVTWVETVPEATEILKTKLRPGDIALVKGSHGLRMDRIINALEVEGQ